MDRKHADDLPTRRTALGALGALTAAAAGWPLGANAAPDCIVSPEEIEGPFFVDERLNRSDLTAGAAHGVPLRLALQVLRVGDHGCEPLTGAQVDLWHADVNGAYSDEASEHTRGHKFLRGYQITGRDGAVAFTTIYPGWYRTRAPHLHVKVRTYAQGRDRTHHFTSQLFFDDAVTNAVLRDPAYAARGPRDTTNATDAFYDRKLRIGLARSGAGYTGTFAIGLRA